MPDFSLEQQYRGSVIGIDEVGRGCIAGPVVSAAVYLPCQKIPDFYAEIKDSKALSPIKRAKLYALIMKDADCGIGVCFNKEIDNINILQATFKSMREAVSHLKHLPQCALVDGNQDPKLGIQTQLVVKGDQKSVSIAAASIIAKHYRDQLMIKLHEEYPQYDWISNKGYPAPKHLQGLATYGITPYHRQSFAPVRRILDAAAA